MRVRALTVLATAMFVVTGTLPAHAVAAASPVKTSKAFEWLPAAADDGSHNYLAWTQDIIGRPKAYDSAFFQVDGGAARRINPGNTYGFMGNFDEGSSRLVYQQLTPPSTSDLRLFDVSSRSFISTPARVNTRAWQWSPSVDTEGGTMWLLYGENRFNGPKAPWRVYLFNATTHKKLLLDSTTNRCGCIFAGDISYPWVVWSKGLMGNVWRYNIDTHVKNRVVLPNDRDEYFASVTADGTVYVAQAGDACGTHARFYRVDPGGAQTLLYALPAGSEPLSINDYDDGAGVTLYSDRYFCGPKTSNIFKLIGVDTATRPPARSTIGRRVRPTAATSRAWLRSRRSSLRCEASGRCRPVLRADATA